MNDLVFHPVLSWPLLIAASAAVLASIGWSLCVGLKSKARRAVLGALRLLILAAIIFVLTQPQEQQQEVTILRPQVAVLVDDSASMNDPVDASQPRRAERVKEFLSSPAVQEARKTYDFRVFNLERMELPAGKAPAEFNANASNIVSGLGQLVDHFKGQPLAAVLVLTDGLDTSGVAKPETAAYDVPVDTFELEKPFTPKPHEQRISIAGADFPPRAVVGWHSEIHLSVVGDGVNGKVVSIELWRAGRKVADATTAFNEDEQTRQVTFDFTHDRPGVDHFEVRVDDPAADKEARAYPFSIDVAEPGKRVLYVQNQLSFDYKFLHQAIVSNRNLQLVSYTRWADGRIVNLDDEAGGAVPALDFSARGLANYAVVILGDLAPDALPAEAWKNLRDYVDQGGGLVLLGGPASYPNPKMGQTPLADVLPIKPPAAFREGNFSVQITETGLHHPVFGPVFAQVKSFAPLTTLNVGGIVAPSAETLMDAVVGGKTTPLVAAVRFGKGRAVSVMSDSVWRWRLAAAQWRMDKSPYELFWTQLLDWMAPKEDERRDSNSIELFTARSSYIQGEKPEVLAIVQTTGGPPSTLPLKVHTPDNRTLEYQLRPGVFQSRDGRSVHGYVAVVEPNVTGIFRAETSAMLGGGGKVNGEVRFVVTRPATEMTGKPIDRAFLQKLAQASKGKYYALGDWDQWRQDLHVEEQHSTHLNLNDLWNNPVLLGSIMCLLAAEWIVRKLWHLP